MVENQESSSVAPSEGSTVQVPIWDVLSCKGKVRVLTILADVGELNITQIVKRAELSHRSAKGYLTELCQAGLVELKEFGRIRIYRYRSELPVAQALQQVFQLWEHHFPQETE